ncbi:glycoside hydrolase domain-containing protein [Nonomuraea sediminis]|uniref:glycoside hydrolase domain-containing protein n=1 Tax=Nonomuraea sediminis TaxID=2835864 RepID=UPI001BDD894E|nr:glycoside hydrolase domain-containing protein [Nonomuraea sediminis]
MGTVIEVVSGWEPAELGNHRVVVEAPAGAVWVSVAVPWVAPQGHHGVGLVTTPSGAEAGHAFLVDGSYVFAPVHGPGRYLLYYAPYVNATKPSYPEHDYLTGPAPEISGDVAQGEVVAYEARTEHDRYTDMERPAPAQDGFVAFGESRENPIRMRHLPARLLERGPGPVRLTADQGEYLVFQIGVYGSCPLSDVRLASDAPGFTCFTLGGLDYLGEPFTRRLDVPAETVHALWCGLPAAPGPFSVTVDADGEPSRTVGFTVEVSDVVRPDAGDDDPARLSRLRWLNSRLADDDTVPRPFTPITVEGPVLGVLGRTVTLGPDGLPAALTSYFTPEVTAVGHHPTELLAAPVTFEIPGTAWESDGWRITHRGQARVTWVSRWRSGPLTLDLEGRFEFDGTLDYRLELSSQDDADLDDARLTLAHRVLPYRMGLGEQGGARGGDLDWHWDQGRNQDAIWLGAVNAGVQVRLSDERYRRPLNTNFYHQRPLVLPRSWHNDGRGGIRTAGDTLVCYGGPRRIGAGERLRFDVRLTLTPGKPIDTAAHFRQRYFHGYRPADEIAATGATVVNTHHATEVNPYINYPFLAADRLKEYVGSLHEHGLRGKLYYTVREISTRAPELWALLGLGEEVLAEGPGGGCSWSREHVGEGRLPAWFSTATDDSSLITSGQSRWHNYYVEGLAWLVRHTGIDGLYLDDLGFDREVTKRVRRVLDQVEEPLIDLHSANQFNERDGFASSANLYLEHLPYVDRLWFGEYFDYAATPDYWLVEMSGIPFGVMGEMLEGGGHPWRGLVHGMTNRLYDGSDPRPMWRLFDTYDVTRAEMLGYWSPRAPVRTGHPGILATTYRGDRGALVALGSWHDGPVEVRLDVDWDALGLDPGTATAHLPMADGLTRTGDTLLVDGGGVVWLG